MALNDTKCLPKRNAEGYQTPGEKEAMIAGCGGGGRGLELRAELDEVRIRLPQGLRRAGPFTLCIQPWETGSVLLASGTVRESALVAISHWICGDVSQQPQDTSTGVLYDSVPGGASGKEPACQCRRLMRCGYNP